MRALVAVAALFLLAAPARAREGREADRVAAIRPVLNAFAADPRQRTPHPCIGPKLVGAAFDDFVPAPPREMARQRYLAAHPELRQPFNPFALGLDDVGRPSRSYRIADRKVSPALDDELHAAALAIVRQPRKEGGPLVIDPSWVRNPVVLMPGGRPTTDLFQKCGDVPVFFSQPAIIGDVAFVRADRPCGFGCGFREMFALHRKGARWVMAARWVTEDKAGYPNGKPF